MANRLSTAEILAAARAADGAGAGGTKMAAPGIGRKSRDERTDSSAASVAVLEREESTENFEEQSTPEQFPSAPADEIKEVVAPTPPSVSKLIAAARGDAQEDTKSSNAPPSIATMLAELRVETLPALPTPPSMSRILTEIRGVSAVTVSKGEISDKPAAAGKKPPVAAGRGSTASILAAARGQGAAGGGKPPAKKSTSSVGEKPSGTAAILAAARKQGGAGGGNPPAKKSASPVNEKPSGTAAILAAARKQGGAGTAASASPTEKPAKTPAPTVSERNSAASRSLGDADRADGRPRPVRIAEILAEIRCEDAAGSTLSELPSLAEMVASLRRLSEEQSARRDGVRTPAMPWTARLRNWLIGRKNRIAVRQFDHS